MKNTTEVCLAAGGVKPPKSSQAIMPSRLSACKHSNYFKKWKIELIADPESDVPLPMLIVRKKRKIVILLEKIFSIFHN